MCVCVFAPVFWWLNSNMIVSPFCQQTYTHTHIHKHWNYLHVVLKMHTVKLSFYLSTQVYLAMCSPNIFYVELQMKTDRIDSNDRFWCWMSLCHGNKKKMCKYLEWMLHSGYQLVHTVRYVCMHRYTYTIIITTTTTITTATAMMDEHNNWNGVHQAHLFAVTTIQMADHHHARDGLIDMYLFQFWMLCRFWHFFLSVVI